MLNIFRIFVSNLKIKKMVELKTLHEILQIKIKKVCLVNIQKVPKLDCLVSVNDNKLEKIVIEGKEFNFKNDKLV